MNSHFRYLKFLRICLFLLVIQSLADGQLFAQTSELKNEFDSKTLSYRGQEAFKDLLETKTFTLAGFGAVAAPFRSTDNLIHLLSEKQAEKAFRTIVRNATPEGQIYALIGLQIIKSKHFSKEFEFFRQNIKENGVTKISSEDGGCDSASTILKIEEAVKKIESEEYAETFSKIYIPQ